MRKYSLSFVSLTKFFVVVLMAVSLTFTPFAGFFGDTSAQKAFAASEPSLLKDINYFTNGSDPENFTEYDGWIWFKACIEDDDSCNLYRTDGTEEGTELFPISIDGNTLESSWGSPFMVAGGLLYFTVYFPDEGESLWATDGTDAWEVADDVEIYEEYDSQGVEFDGDLYFINNSSPNGRKLFKADGSVAVDISAGVIADGDYPYIGNLSIVGDELFFFLEREYEEGFEYSDGESYEIWRVNDARNGIEVVEDFAEFSENRLFAASNLFAAGGTFYFIAYDDLFDGEGVLEGFYLYKFVEEVEGFSIELVKNISTQTCNWDWGYLECDELYPAGLAELNDKLFFLADDGNRYYQPWISDGTEVGTVLLPNTVEDMDRVYVIGVDTGVVPNVLWYGAESGDNEYVMQATDGDEYNISISLPAGWADTDWDEGASALHEGTPFFLWCDYEEEYGCELWRVNDERNATELVLDINAGDDGSFPDQITSSGGMLYFNAEADAYGEEPWVSDGTAEGTEMIVDLNTSTSDSSGDEEAIMATVGDVVFFSARDPEYGTELWVTDGTTSGTVLVKDIVEGGASSYPRNFVALGDYVYFTAYDTDGDQTRLWRSDGTAEGTVIVEDTDPFDTDFRAVVHENALFFVNREDGGDLFIKKAESDDSVTIVSSGFDQVSTRLFSVDDGVYFAGVSADTKGIFKATSEGTSVVHDWTSDGYWANDLIFADESALYYAALDASEDPFASGFWRLTANDSTPVLITEGGVRVGGTLGGAAIIFMNEGGSLVMYKVLVTGELEVITTFDTDHDYIGNINSTDEHLFFTIAYPEELRGLWVTDGTEEGTMRLIDSEDLDDPNNFSVIAGGVYFSAEDAESGVEPWKSDGTVEGTEMLGDVSDGTYLDEGDEFPRGSYPMGFALAGTNLVFYASTPQYGEEPWVVGGIDIPEEEEEEPEPEPENNSGGGSSGNRRSSSRSVTAAPAALTTQQADQSSRSTSAFARDLDIGSTGSDVKELQRFLNINGFPVAPSGPGSLNNETELFGELTRAALARFQAANGIVPAVGYLGPITRAFIASMNGVDVVAATPAESPELPQTVRDLDIGMSGDDVRALQSLLIREGYAIPAGATGFFATQTRDALAAYQAKYGITPSAGYFGLKTRTQMKSAGLAGLWW